MTTPGLDIRAAADVGEVFAAAHLFDAAPLPEATATFLRSPGHHLLLAYLDDRVVGMVTGVEMTMPDKGTEMFLYELGVDESARGRGVGTALAAALAAIARERGLYDMWVLTDLDNEAAVRAYRRSGATVTEPTTLLLWEFTADPAG